MDVLGLLQSKNRCLQRFLTLSEDFFSTIQNGDLSTLEMFQTRRESTIKALDLYDRKITEVISQLLPTERTQALIDGVTRVLEEKDRLIHRILAADEKIILKIEDEKNRVQRELSSSQKSRDMLKRFKSSWVPESGEEIDRNL
jgi:hypothetical protein